MSKIIECRRCDSPICTGCNIHTLAEMLHKGKLDQLMDRHRSVNPGADVAPVVRCKDCRYSYVKHFPNKDVLSCENENVCGNEYLWERLPDDFCSYGERRPDNG